jgi:hypothetical protein
VETLGISGAQTRKGGPWGSDQHFPMGRMKRGRESGRGGFKGPSGIHARIEIARLGRLAEGGKRVHRTPAAARAEINGPIRGGRPKGKRRGVSLRCRSVPLAPRRARAAMRGGVENAPTPCFQAT